MVGDSETIRKRIYRTTGFPMGGESSTSRTTLYGIASRQQYIGCAVFCELEPQDKACIINKFGGRSKESSSWSLMACYGERTLPILKRPKNS